MKTLGVILCGVAGLVGIVYGMTAINLATKPAEVVNRVASVDNILNSYNDFYNVKNAFDARIGNIKDLKTAEDDYSKKDLMGARQACRELASQYNSNSSKMTTKFFKSNELPETLEMEKCDA